MDKNSWDQINDFMLFNELMNEEKKGGSVPDTRPAYVYKGKTYTNYRDYQRTVAADQQPVKKKDDKPSIDVSHYRIKKKEK